MVSLRSIFYSKYDLSTQRLSTKGSLWLEFYYRAYVPFLRWVCVNCLEHSMTVCQIRTKAGTVLCGFASILRGPCRLILIGIDISALIGLIEQISILTAFNEPCDSYPLPQSEDKAKISVPGIFFWRVTSGICQRAGFPFKTPH